MLSAVEIEINTECNLKCEYCPNYSEERDENGEMDFKLFEKILLDLNEINFSKRLSYHFYGEPLVNENLVKYIKMANDVLTHSITNMLFSNGTLLSYKKVIELFSVGINFIYITRHKGISELPIDKFFNDLDPEIQKKIKIKDYKKIDFTTRDSLVNQKYIKASKGVETRSCLVPKRSIYITKEGNLLPCFEDYHQRAVMGNLRLNSIKEVLNSKKYQNFSKNAEIGARSKNNICSDCISEQLIVS